MNLPVDDRLMREGLKRATITAESIAEMMRKLPTLELRGPDVFVMTDDVRSTLDGGLRIGAPAPPQPQLSMLYGIPFESYPSAEAAKLRAIQLIEEGQRVELLLGKVDYEQMAAEFWGTPDAQHILQEEIDAMFTEDWIIDLTDRLGDELSLCRRDKRA